MPKAARALDELLMTDVMMEVKKLRTLQRKGNELERTKVVDKTRKYLRQVGDHIEVVAGRKGSKAAGERRRLWDFVSTFTENNMKGPKLMSIYQRLASGDHPVADHGLLGTGRAGSGGDAMGDAGEDGELMDLRRGHTAPNSRHAAPEPRPRSGQQGDGWGSHGERSRWRSQPDSPGEQGWEAQGPEGSEPRGDQGPEEDWDDGEYEPGESREPSWPGHDRSEDRGPSSRDWDHARSSKRGAASHDDYSPRSSQGRLSSSYRPGQNQLSCPPLRQHAVCAQRGLQICAAVKDWAPPTISDTKQKFYQQFKTPINPIYNTVIQELLVQQHLMRWNINYKYDAIFGLGFTSVFDQVLGGLPAEQSKKLFKAYLNALDEDPDQYRKDSEQIGKWAAEKKGSPDQVTPKEDGDDFQKALAAVAEKGKMGNWHYTRFFAIGLFRILELTEAKDPKALNTLVKAMNANPDAVNRDLMTYRGVLSKLNAAKEMMKELVEREQRKMKEREAEKAEKAKAASSQAEAKPEAKTEPKPADVKA
ncbi:hypothetical protein WJX84_009589 [Apatococcus fuscideae]|uniref:Chromodomain-helicase-DNA-binding protein 1-like C-terminal domain-containing protein n=1 Tax=Apatococcus fuscideae TaxID=2026836 RepID=A0AAW1SXW6_9CHLO